MSNLSARAKEAEERAAAARSQAKADLEKSPKRGESRRAGAGRPAARHRHQNIDAKKAELAAKSAARSADIAEEDALFAIDYAYATIEEAEYAALDAVLARMDADELAAK
jgi:hypothetical protein